MEGDAGVGKTALLRAFARREPRTRGRRRPRALSLRPPREPPYEPVHHAALAATSRRLYARLGGERQAREVASDWLSAIPGWGDLLRAITATVEVLERRRRERAFREIDTLDEEIEALLAASRRRPLVLLIDELERADAGAIQRLQTLVEVADEGARLLLVGAYRPTAPGVPDPPVHRLRRELPSKGESFLHLRLEGLGPEALDAWLRARFPGSRPPESFVGWLLETTGGHPATVRDCLAQLEAAGALRLEGGVWHFEAGTEPLALPERGASFADLGALEPQVASVVTAAAGLGEEFDALALAGLLARDELEVEDRLAQAVHVALLENLGEVTTPEGEVTTRFRFRSAHVRAALQRAAVPPSNSISARP